MINRRNKQPPAPKKQQTGENTLPHFYKSPPFNDRGISTTIVHPLRKFPNFAWFMQIRCQRWRLQAATTAVWAQRSLPTVTHSQISKFRLIYANQVSIRCQRWKLSCCTQLSELNAVSQRSHTHKFLNFAWFMRIRFKSDVNVEDWAAVHSCLSSTQWIVHGTTRCNQVSGELIDWQNFFNQIKSLF